MSETLSVPSHVPPELVRADFDYNRDPHLSIDPHEAMARFVGPRVFWSPNDGGYWVLTKGADQRQALASPELFSNHPIGIPSLATNTRLIPEELDPPEHGKYRAALAPHFSPRAALRYQGTIEGIVSDLLDEIVDRGECDYVEDYAVPIPATLFLPILGLPKEDAPTFRKWNHDATKQVDDLQARVAAIGKIQDYLADVIAERRTKPGDDLVSKLLESKIGDEPITDEDAHGMLFLLFVASQGTTVASLSFMTRHLATHPTDRQFLVRNPDAVPQAVEEMLRYYPLNNHSRRVTEDVEFAGVEMRAGDRILIVATLGERDPEAGLGGDTIDITRPASPQHTSFGHGIHRCLGAHIARLELSIALREWHRRIPDYEIRPDATVVGFGTAIMGLRSLPLVWSRT